MGIYGVARKGKTWLTIGAMVGTFAIGASSSASASSAPSAASILSAAFKGVSGVPPTSAPTPKKGLNVWVLSCGQESEGCSGPSDAAMAAGKAIGWKMHLYDGAFGQNNAFTLGVNQAVADGAKAIIPIGVDCNQAQGAFAAADKAGVKIIAANSFDCTDPLIKSGPNLFSGQLKFATGILSSESINQAEGTAQAAWIIEVTKGHARIIDMNFEGVTGEQYKERGFINEIKTCAGCKIVDTITFTPENLFNNSLPAEMSTALAANPTANAIQVPEDSVLTTAAVPQALAAVNRTKSVEVVGGSDLPQNLGFIKSGAGQEADVSYSLTWVGWGVVDEANRVLDGQPTVAEGIGYQMIDKTHNLAGGGASTVNFQKAYLKIWK